MIKKNHLRWLLIALAGLAPAACRPTSPPFECTDTIGCVEIAPGEPLKLGVVQALSGGVAPVGLDQTRGVELALDARGNRLLGHPIELLIEDERCSSEGGTMAAMKVVADTQVVAIIGTTCSGSATTAANIVSEAGLAMISGTNTAPSLTTIGGAQGVDWQPGYFRTAHNDAIAARAVALFAFQELGVTKSATLDDGDTYTRGYAEGFRQSFIELGGEVVLVAGVDKGDGDMQPVLTAVAASEADMLFFPLFPPEADLIVLQAREVPGMEDVTLVGGGALLTNGFIKSVGVDGVGVYATGLVPLMTPVLEELHSAYEARYGEPPQTSALGLAYDATAMLLNAVEATVVQDPYTEGTLHIGRQALRDTLHATTGFESTNGTYTCDAFGDCSLASLYVMRLDDPTAGLEGFASNVVFTYDRED